MADHSGFVPQSMHLETAQKAAASLPNGAPPSVSAPFGYKPQVTSHSGSATAHPPYPSPNTNMNPNFNPNLGASNGMHNVHHNHPGSLSSQSSRDSSPASASRYNISNHDSMSNHIGASTQPRPQFQHPTQPGQPNQDPLRGQSQGPLSAPGQFQQQNRPAPFGLTRPVGPSPSWQNYTNSSTPSTTGLRPGAPTGPPVTSSFVSPSAATLLGGPSGNQPSSRPQVNQPPSGPLGSQPPSGPLANQPPSGPLGSQPPAGPLGSQPSSGPMANQPPSGPLVNQPSLGPPTSSHRGPVSPSGFPTGQSTSLNTSPTSGPPSGRPNVPFSGPPTGHPTGSATGPFSEQSTRGQGPPSGLSARQPPSGLTPGSVPSGLSSGPSLSGLFPGPPSSGPPSSGPLSSGPPPSGLSSVPTSSGFSSGLSSRPPQLGLSSGPPPSGPTPALFSSGPTLAGFSSGPPPRGPPPSGLSAGPPSGLTTTTGQRPPMGASAASFPGSGGAPPLGSIPGFPTGPPPGPPKGPSFGPTSAAPSSMTSLLSGPPQNPYNMGPVGSAEARPGLPPGPPSGAFNAQPRHVSGANQMPSPQAAYQYTQTQASRPPAVSQPNAMAPSPGQYQTSNRQAAAYPEAQQNQYGPASGDQQRRYPPAQPYGPDGLVQQMGQLNVTQMGYNKLWGYECHDLLQSRNILPAERVRPPGIRLVNEFSQAANCSPDIFRCTVTKIPETKSLLQKSRLPLGILIYPFKDLECLPLVQSDVIVRCRHCRTYINPFVYFTDDSRWKCNLCFRTNELPGEFLIDPVRKVYSDPSKRPEVNSSTIEFIAPSEYMLRPPQPAVYLFLMDVSRFAVETGYLHQVCGIILDSLKELPGDSRTAIGFITFDSSVHFYSLAEGMSTPQQMVVMDIDDVFLPCPENLLANLREHMNLVQELLTMLPNKFQQSYDTGCALGAALQAAYKLMAPTGGRISVFQCCLPNKGPGALTPREDPSNRASSEVAHLNPATDFYKRLALDFSSQQTAVDLFLLNQQYSDLATLSGVSKFSGGCIYHFPLYQSNNVLLSDSFECALHRYLKRKIGFEAVMRIRCTRGLSIHTFHGNFFVRTTDLLALPNVNPDAGFGMQVMIDENLTDLQTVSFQSAVLYTSSRGERRIRVHTLCLPVCSNLSDVLHSADQQCIVGLLAKMAVDRSLQSSISDARDAFINVAIDVLSAFKLTQSSGSSTALLVPNSLKLLPLYILALLKSEAFRTGTSTRLDDRVFSMCQMKTLPLDSLIQKIYPDLYPVHNIDQYELEQVDELVVPLLPRLHLSAEKLDAHGAFLMDAGDFMMLLVGRAIPITFCENVLGVSSFGTIPDDMYDLPELETDESKLIRNFIMLLQMEKPYNATLHIIREDSKHRLKFMERLIEDRTESSLSYYEFLQHLKSQVK